MHLSLPLFRSSSWLAWPKPPPSARTLAGAFAPPFLIPEPLAPQPAELRIDVDPPAATIEEELAALHERMHTPGDCLHGIARIPLLDGPDLVARYREADGEHYVYVEDLRRRCLAGCTVFNRLVELDRHADKHLRAPHSRYASAYQRRGLATAVYRWALDGGMCLISGARQSQGAHALWQRLAGEHLSFYARLQSRRLAYLGPDVPGQVLDDLHTRRLLLGPRWTLARLCAATGMRC